MNMQDLLRAGLLTVALAGMLAAQGTGTTTPTPRGEGQPDQVQTQGNQAERDIYAADPNARPINPGTNNELSNHSQPANQQALRNTPETNATLQPSDQKDGPDLGWLGLLGLAGLFGLMRRPGKLEQPRGNENRVEYNPGVSR